MSSVGSRRTRGGARPAADRRRVPADDEDEERSSRQMSIDVPYIPDEGIEAEACALLAGYARKAGARAVVPALLLDDLLQHLELRFESDDLRGRFGIPDVLGAIWVEDRFVRIDETLDPDERPAMRGRFNFSLAHEIGHWCLHRGYVELRRAVEDLFGEPPEPTVICRTSRKRER